MEELDEMGSLDGIDSYEDLLYSLNNQLSMKENKIRECLKEIEKQEPLQERENKLLEEEDSLKSVQSGYFVWDRATKVRNCEAMIEKIEQGIQKYKKQIEDVNVQKKECEDLRKRIDEITKKLHGLKVEDEKPTEKPWRFIRGHDSIYNKQVKDNFLSRFNTLDISRILKNWKEGASSKFVNIILIGSTGSGKSSFINTCTTALQNSGDMVHATVDQKTTTASATKRLNLAPLKCSKGDQLPIRLFDSRGIHKDIGHKEMEKIILGHIKPNAIISEVSEMEAAGISYNENPGLINEMHCIVYVVRADKLRTQSMELDASVTEIGKVRRKFTENNIPQCVIVTNIDRVIPKNDISQLFYYHIALRYCKRAADALQIPLKYVHPMSNYHDEGTPNDEKDALALDILWKMTRMGMNRLENHENRNDILDDFFE